jgi:hypothetical protein
MESAYVAQAGFKLWVQVIFLIQAPEFLGLHVCHHFQLLPFYSFQPLNISNDAFHITELTDSNAGCIWKYLHGYLQFNLGTP